MNKLLLTAIVLVSTITVVQGEASADPFQLANNHPLGGLKQEPPQEKKKPKPKIVTVASGDTLNSIAKKHKTSWQRIYYKNKKITNPDSIEVGLKLTIPEASEKLKKRPIGNYPLGVQSFNHAPQNSSGGKLIAGTLGYALPYGNCVQEPGVNNPGWGNPIDWPVLSMKPTIGATALWTYNHTGVVVGLWSNGDVEVRHQNYGGGQTRFPASAFRGYR